MNIDTPPFPEYHLDNDLGYRASFGENHHKRTFPSTKEKTNGEWGGWRGMMRARVGDKQVWNVAAARRSSLIMALEVDVATEELPSRWPTIVIGHRMFAFGICNLPPLSNPCRNNTYVRASPMCSPYLPAPENAVVNTVDAAMAAQFDNTDTPDIRIQMPENPGDACVGVQNSATAQDFARTVVWTGYMRVCAIPTHLRSASESCLVYRRIVKDLSDNNKILEDTFTILYVEKHFSRHFVQNHISCRSPCVTVITRNTSCVD
jgi:hypothetical protein